MVKMFLLVILFSSSLFAQMDEVSAPSMSPQPLPVNNNNRYERLYDSTGRDLNLLIQKGSGRPLLVGAGLPAASVFASGTTAISTGDSVQVSITGLLSTDIAIAVPFGNQIYTTGVGQTITAASIFEAGKLTVFGASGKKMSYVVYR